jgi:hypothetical protein
LAAYVCAAPSPSGEADQHHPAAAAGELDEIVEADIRHAQRRQAAIDVADDLDAVLVQAEHIDGDDSDDYRDERSGGRPAPRAAGSG